MLCFEEFIKKIDLYQMKCKKVNVLGTDRDIVMNGKGCVCLATHISIPASQELIYYEELYELYKNEKVIFE